MKLQNAVTLVAEWSKLNAKKAVIALGVVLLLSFWAGHASAQTLKWSESRITWTAPQSCVDGSPITDCPITGYRIETAASATASTWSLVSTVGAAVLTHTATGLTAGTRCYRVFALSGSAMSPPSNVECKTTVGPAPGAPGLRTIDTVAYDIKFDWRKWRYAINKPVGTVPLGAECHKDFALGGGYYRVERSDVDFDGRRQPAVVVAKCG